MNRANVVTEKIIDYCSDCPFHYKEIYDDSFEALEDVTFICEYDCAYSIIKEHQKVLANVNIPNWCPIKITN